MVSTQFDRDGFRMVPALGKRGSGARGPTLASGVPVCRLNGNITLLIQVCEQTRAQAFDLRLRHAAERGGNAVVVARHNASEIKQAVREVLVYGRAVLVEPFRPS